MKYIKSKYINITSNDKGDYIIYHSFYGKIVKVGAKIIEFLDYFSTPKTIEEYCKEKEASLVDVKKAFDSCVERKYLIEYDEKKEISELESIKQDPSLDRYPERLLRFYVTTQCNMACSYCFEGNHSNSKFMSIDTIKDGLKAFNKWLIDNDDRDFQLLKVNFFGGEPLICYDLLKRAVPYIKEMLQVHNVNTKITINTNGTLLDSEKIKWLIDNEIHTYISVDGLKEQHDKHRIFKNGSGTFDVVINNLKRLIETAPPEYVEKHLTVLVTINPGNVFEVRTLIRFLSSVGIKNISLNAAFNCAVSTDITNWTILNEKEIDTFIKESIVVRDVMYDKGVHIGGMWGYIPNRLKDGGVAFCQAVGYEIGICPSRKLYACPCTFGDESHSIGVLEKADFSFNKNYLKWRGRKVTNTESCDSCNISGICRGGCPGVSILNNKDIYSPQQCEFWKKFIKSFISNIL